MSVANTQCTHKHSDTRDTTHTVAQWLLRHTACLWPPGVLSLRPLWSRVVLFDLRSLAVFSGVSQSWRWLRVLVFFFSFYFTFTLSVSFMSSTSVSGIGATWSSSPCLLIFLLCFFCGSHCELRFRRRRHTLFHRPTCRRRTAALYVKTAAVRTWSSRSLGQIRCTKRIPIWRLTSHVPASHQRVAEISRRLGFAPLLWRTRRHRQNPQAI